MDATADVPGADAFCERCDGGMCVDLMSDLQNCGTCGNRCPDRANSTRTCSGGGCGFTCNSGFADCDRNAENGCECSGMCITGIPSGGAGVCSGTSMDAGTDASRDSGVDAGRDGGVDAWAMDAGGDASCPFGFIGFADCDGNPSNGCEANTNTNVRHCGACGVQCGPGEVCMGGRCTCGRTSRSGGPACTSLALTNHCCNDMCVHTDIDPNNCGGCGNRCTSSCNTSRCSS
ncbi:MAG: hypothetical protein NZM37_00570 [Sandaracinaceae bacterium]|nr:hypothetical protein [Sandaracinaceae bacterium]